MLGSDIPDWAFAEAGLDDLNMTAPIDDRRVRAFRQTSPSERLHGTGPVAVPHGWKAWPLMAAARASTRQHYSSHPRADVDPVRPR